MVIFDVVLLLILAGFVFYGLFFGLIKTIGSLLGVIVGAWVAGQWYLDFYDWTDRLFMGHANVGKVISFIIVFVLVNRLVGLLFVLLDKFFHLLTIIPFLKTINRLAGAIFGFLEGALVLGLLLYVASRYTLVESWISKLLADSKLAPWLVQFTDILTPLLPELLKQLKSII